MDFYSGNGVVRGRRGQQLKFALVICQLASSVRLGSAHVSTQLGHSQHMSAHNSSTARARQQPCGDNTQVMTQVKACNVHEGDNPCNDNTQDTTQDTTQDNTQDTTQVKACNVHEGEKDSNDQEGEVGDPDIV